MPTIKQYEPSERAQQIIVLAKEAQDGAEEVRTRIRRSTEAALECGRLLLKEREHIRQKLGHGAWESYYEITFSKVVTLRQARNWMNQVKREISPLPSHSAPNELRNAVLTLGLFPPKVHTVSAAKAPASSVAPSGLTIPPHSTHLGIINRFSAWHTWLTQETRGDISPTQAAQLRSDFAPILQFGVRLDAIIEAGRRATTANAPR